MQSFKKNWSKNSIFFFLEFADTGVRLSHFQDISKLKKGSKQCWHKTIIRSTNFFRQQHFCFLLQNFPEFSVQRQIDYEILVYIL